jgi:hypothetical protein
MEDHRPDMNSLFHSILLNFSTQIGLFEDGKFILGDNALDSLKDIKRVLRDDYSSNKREMFLLMGEWNVLDKHLLPGLMVAKNKAFEQLFCNYVNMLLFSGNYCPVDMGS